MDRSSLYCPTGRHDEGKTRECTGSTIPQRGSQQRFFRHACNLCLSIQRETVPVTVDSMDVSRIVRIRFDLPPQASNQIIDTASERDVLIAPHIPEEFIASHDLARTRAHITQHLDFALAERNLFIVPFCRIVIKVDVQGTEKESIVGWMDPSHHSFDARQKFIQCKWLCDVVVGSETQSLQFVFFLCPRGQNNDSGP